MIGRFHRRWFDGEPRRWGEDGGGVAVVETKNLWLASLVDAEIVGRLDRVWPGAG